MTETPAVHGPLLIVCSRPGFRRAGVVHAAETIWPADTFGADQLAALGAEPLLWVADAIALEPAPLPVVTLIPAPELDVGAEGDLGAATPSAAEAAPTETGDADTKPKRRRGAV
ncbi:hypothetical protein ACQW02_19915 [Humitalea sp. 24SJ18S-53]|uniref:hypothetical protein n=1 Tax=Humitalea sp. 24SJ18S-53 TaxID=3422307 RepID=UPI003D6679FB